MYLACLCKYIYIKISMTAQNKFPVRCMELLVKQHNSMPKCILSRAIFQKFHYWVIWWKLYCWFAKLHGILLIWRPRLLGDNLLAGIERLLPGEWLPAQMVIFVRLLTHLPWTIDRHFAEDIFSCIFVNEKFWIVIKISLNFVPNGPIDNNLALV